ncbi:MAG: hypothetical protein KBT34_14190 [Prevotella sp.]|nr:hypothetical protein [Candidatus Prevotella equi]
MKKIFTLISATMMAVAANAIDLKVNQATSFLADAQVFTNDLAAVSFANNKSTPTLIKDEADAASPVTYAGETFTHYIGLRVTDAPTKTSPTGTAHESNIALVIEAKKNVDVTLYYKIGSTKSIDCYDQTAGESVAIKQTATNPGEDYLFCTGVYKLQEGHTYTIWAKGGTVQFHGLNTATGTYVAPSSKVYGYSASANLVTYSDGATMQISGNTEKSYASAGSIKGVSSIKNSNGAQNTFTAPTGKVIKSVTFYFAANKDGEEGKLSEINGEKGDFASAVGKIHSTPAEYTYNLETPVTSFTFTFSNKQVNFVLDIEFADASSAASVKAEEKAAKKVNKFVKNGKVVIVSEDGTVDAAGAQQ